MQRTHYDGDDTFSCEITFPLYEQGSGNETVTISYDGEYSTDVKEKILKEIWEYIEDPDGWTQEYIEKGSDVFLKLRVLDNAIEDCTRRLGYERRSTQRHEERLEKLQQQKQALLAQKKVQ